MKENENKEKELAKEKKEMQHNANHYKILHGGARTAPPNAVLPPPRLTPPFTPILRSVHTVCSHQVR